ncbi:MAG: hypothetical protein JWQ95_2966 [Sphaerisporangium sp.]|nr:hypothetical protein [Sphaerisporangium sp.]
MTPAAYRGESAPASAGGRHTSPRGRISAPESRKNHDLPSLGLISLRTVAAVSGVTVVLGAVGLGITVATTPPAPGSPSAPPHPASRASPPAAPPDSGSAAVHGPAAGRLFEEDESARHAALTASGGQAEPPERLWTGFVPAPLESATVDSYAVSVRAETKAATTPRGTGGRSSYGYGRRSHGTRRHGPPTAWYPWEPGRPDRPGTPSSRPRRPATPPEPAPREQPSEPRQEPSQPRAQQPPADRPDQMPNPCATFKDFRRDYCDQLLGGRAGSR